MAKLEPGGKPPLFDRLVTPESGVPPARLELGQVKASIQNALSLLISTRSPRTLDDYLSKPLTTLDWGVPDFGSLSPSTESDRRLMAKVIERAIAVFEPRLSQAMARPAPPSAGASSEARFDIQANLTLSPLQERLSFTVGVNRAQ